MRVLVCGGRDFTNRVWLERELALQHAFKPITLLIHGGARGADSLAGHWARTEGIPELRFEADWKKLGKAAGPVRNQLMIDEGKPDMVMAFPGGRGTADMVKRAQEASIKVEII